MRCDPLPLFHFHYMPKFRDIKPENFLFRSQDSASALCLADFGFAKEDHGDLVTPHFTPAYVCSEVSLLSSASPIVYFIFFFLLFLYLPFISFLCLSFWLPRCFCLLFYRFLAVAYMLLCEGRIIRASESLPISDHALFVSLVYSPFCK